MSLKKLLTYLSVGILTAGLIYAFILYSKAFSPNTSFSESKAYVLIPTNATPNQARDSIKQFVNDWEQFESVFKQFEMDKKIFSGRFELTKGMNNFEIAQALRKNVPVRVTFNNQETLQDLAKRLDKQLEPTAEEFIEIFTEAKFLEQNQATKENALGLFMPNTYEFYWNVNPLKVRNTIHKEYIKFWNADRTAKAKEMGYSPLEINNLASIVQKESAKIDERPRVAGVYLNRLKKGIQLQADPTVIYAKKLTMQNFDTIIKRVYLNDLKINNPYNTYLYKGLPPGPIAMSDVSSIDAVLNAENHNYIYFCASVSRIGYHEFATTMEEHSKNRDKYIKWIEERGIK